MRIDPKIPAAETSGTSRVNEPQIGSAKNSPTTTTNQPTDTVQLSSGQATVRNLVSRLDQVPDTRQTQINALRSEIQSGQFNRNNDQVAGAVVLQLLGNA